MITRQIVLDTETTGLNPRTGDRIIEIGCVELIDRHLTGNNFHRYVNPQRASDPGALAVHGLTEEFLSDKPLFADIVEELRAYVAGAEILIHNAAFDVGFLDMEFGRLDLPAFAEHCGKITDTLAMAKEMHPGKRNSLDALCERHGVSNAHRTLHGALLDAELLAEVYLAMTRGQDSLVIDIDAALTVEAATMQTQGNLQVLVLRASEDECTAHEKWLDALEKERKSPSIWRRPAGEGGGA